MTVWEWARKEARKKYGNLSWQVPYAIALQSEHKRALRVLGQVERTAKLSQYQWTSDQKNAYLAALADVRAAITKGRK